IGLASLGLFGSREVLMPLWAPFVLIGGSQWLVVHLERRAATMAPADEEKTSKAAPLPGTSLYIALLAVVTLLITWLSIYTQTAFFLDPTWVLTMLGDILLLNLHAYQVLTIVALACYFCWRGIRLSRRTIEPAQVFNSLRLG